MRWLVVVLFFFAAGCRGCSDEEKPAPPMPRGMLVPAPSGATVPAERGDYTLHHERISSGVELHLAGPADTERGNVDIRGDAAEGAAAAVWLSLDAMTVFHDAFARAYQPGTFDLFVPRIVDGKALAVELRALLERLAPGTVRDALARTGAELIQFVEARERLWVLTL